MQQHHYENPWNGLSIIFFYTQTSSFNCKSYSSLLSLTINSMLCCMCRQYGWDKKHSYNSSEMPLSSPFLELVALVILLNTYLEQACYCSIKLYSGHSFNLHLNSVFLLVGISTLSYLINKMHCQLEHAGRAESSTANLCFFLPPATWSCIKLGAWSLGSGHPELLGSSKSQTSIY